MEGEADREDLVGIGAELVDELLLAELGVGLDEGGARDFSRVPFVAEDDFFGGKRFGVGAVKDVDDEADLGDVGRVESGEAEAGVEDVDLEQLEEVVGELGPVVERGE